MSTDFAVLKSIDQGAKKEMPEAKKTEVQKSWSHLSICEELTDIINIHTVDGRNPAPVDR